MLDHARPCAETLAKVSDAVSTKPARCTHGDMRLLQPAPGALFEPRRWRWRAAWKPRPSPDCPRLCCRRHANTPPRRWTKSVIRRAVVVSANRRPHLAAGRWTMWPRWPGLARRAGRLARRRHGGGAGQRARLGGGVRHWATRFARRCRRADSPACAGMACAAIFCLATRRAPVAGGGGQAGGGQRRRRPAARRQTGAGGGLAAAGRRVLMLGDG